MILHLSFTLIFLDIRGGREDLNLKFGDLKGKNLSKRYPDLNLFAFFQFMEDRNLGENMYLKVFLRHKDLTILRGGSQQVTC